MVVRRLFHRGLRRWHWFGDKDQDDHPHLNYLVEGVYESAGVAPVEARSQVSVASDWAHGGALQIRLEARAEVVLAGVYNQGNLSGLGLRAGGSRWS